MNHLTDEQLQEYLDNKSGFPDEQVGAHLEACPECREALARYEKLYSVLSVDTAPELPRHFTSSVMTAIEAESSPAVKRPDAVTVFGLVGFLAGITAIAIFADLSPILTWFNLDKVSAWFDQLFVDIVGMVPVDISIVFMAFFVLAAIGAIDYFIQHRGKGKPATFVV